MDVRPEFSRPIDLAQLPYRGLELVLEPDERERRLLAERMDVIAVERLKARVAVTGERDSDLYDARGEVVAEIVQHCVVTLEPVPASLAFSFTRQLTTAAPETASEWVIDATSEDEPDHVPDGIADLGEIVTEELILALPPYPRAAEASGPVSASAGTEAKPFDVLANLVRRTS